MNWHGPAAPGRRPKYLDRPLSHAERQRIYRLRKKGVNVPERDPTKGIREALDAHRLACVAGEFDGIVSATRELVEQVHSYLGQL